MAGLLALLGPAGRVGARVRPRATWFLGAAAPCAPPPLLLPLLRPGPDAPLLRAARGHSQGHQEGERNPVRHESRRFLPQHISPSVVCAQDPGKITATTGRDGGSTEEKKPSKSQQLRKIFQEYGAVGVSLHIGISLISLGVFYTVISSGVDMSAVLLKLGFKESLVQSKMAAGTSTFVVAYAIHKLFAPVRISITLVSVPFIVRYFRKVGFFKPPAAKP
ncbi:protein FAM210B, mitochondrial isoform X1 [Leopardus geoffroyi]|uniref:protein FAM210B, mitochondrial isoform X1 n=1 Tax=Leopardus geoffroyi TaxID=46844 RepID=UPI001E25E93D|nr:protein FAM210B, mitochondrial isoform X1 [Leopardus geoffroyi]